MQRFRLMDIYVILVLLAVAFAVAAVAAYRAGMGAAVTPEQKEQR